MDIKKSLKDVLVLFVICCVFGTLLAVVNSMTAQVIRDRENAPVDDSVLREYLPEGSDFQEITLNEQYPSAVKRGWKCAAGCVFRVEVKGYKAGLVIMIGIDSEGKIVKVKHESTNETFGAESELDKDYTEKADTLDTLTELPSASQSGAPMTTKAYYNALKAALEAAKIAGGGKTTEQMFMDSCNEALGTTDLTFTRWFATEVIEGIDKIYEASDKSGYVFIIGESLIGVKENGITTPDVSEENTATVNAAYSVISSSTVTEITDIPDEIDNKIVKKAYVTASGNYVFDLEAEGYDVKFEYSHGHEEGNTPKPIVIRISISSDGKIIDCMTVSQSESEGFGDKCATEEYRDSWIGAEDSDLTVVDKKPSHNSDHIPNGSTDLGAISSATYTTQGYQKAVKAAFKAFEILTGGNE